MINIMNNRVQEILTLFCVELFWSVFHFAAGIQSSPLPFFGKKRNNFKMVDEG